MADPFEEAIAALEALDLEGLREEWRRVYGPPPPLRSAEFLRRLLSWRLQADRFGGLAPEVTKALRGPERRRKPVARLAEGVRLSREWQGRRYDVETLPDGRFRLDGEVYGSLSQVARKITGVRWNGPRFFGLRSEAER